MRPRMYGSSESHRFFTRTSPSLGAETGDDSTRKLSSVTQPAGRLASTTRLLSMSGRRETCEVVVCIAKLLRDHRKTAERMADLHLFGHAHAAVQLDRFLAHVPRRIGDLYF